MARKKVVVALVAVMWAGSLWMALCAGFTYHLSIATFQSTLSDRVRLHDQKRLLGQLKEGNADAARQSLEEGARIDEELVRLNEGMPEFGTMDVLLAGFHPRTLIDLARVARESREHDYSSLKGSSKQQ